MIPRGISNVGSTCYIAAGLQCFASCKFFVETLNKTKHNDSLIINSLNKLLSYVNGNSSEPAIHAFIDAIRPSFSSWQALNEQGDTQEFLLRLLEVLHRELNRGITYDVNNSGSIMRKKIITPDDLSKMMRRQWKAYCNLDGGPTVLHDLMHGQNIAQVTCTVCDHVSHTPDVFSVLTLMPSMQRQGSCTLADAVSNYFQTENIEGFHCEKCRKATKAIRISRLWRLPRVLMIALPVYLFQNSEVQEITTLHLGKYTLFREAPHTQHVSYRLRAFVCHSGSLRYGGHYYAVRSFDVAWYRCDDDNVQKCDLSRADKPCFMVFEQV